MIDGNPDSWESHAINTDNINTDLKHRLLIIHLQKKVYYCKDYDNIKRLVSVKRVHITKSVYEKKTSIFFQK